MKYSRKIKTYKCNIINNIQRKHILLASKAKHSLTSQVKIHRYIKAKSCRLFEKLHIVSLKSAKLLYIVSDRCIAILYCMFLLWSPYVSYVLSLPNLSGRRLDVYHTLAHDVALVQI